VSRESKIEKEVCEYAESKGLEHRKLQWAGRRDAPDRIFWGQGVYPFVIEFKRPNGEFRRGQRMELASLREAGMDARMCDSVEQGKEIIDAHTK
jgi:tRNA U54 and U55 pseudouridine synthase Pus10